MADSVAQKDKELIVTERAFLAGYLMGMSGTMSLRQVMAYTGLGARGAYHLMTKASRVVPIRCERGIWRDISKENE